MNARGRKEQGIAAFKKIAKEERVKGCHLREDNQGGERDQRVATFKKIAKNERAKCCHLQENSQGGKNKVLPLLKRHKDSVCESKEK